MLAILETGVNKARTGTNKALNATGKARTPNGEVVPPSRHRIKLISRILHRTGNIRICTKIPG